MIYVIYNTVAPLKLLNDFHRKRVYLCNIYDSPPGIIDETYGTICSNEYKSQMPSLFPTKSESADFCLCSFQKSWHIVHEMFPLLRVWQAHHSRLLYQNGRDSRDAAWDHRLVLDDSSLGKGKSKGRFYIAQRFTLFALPVHSDTNSASPGSILTMQQLCVTTKSLTFPPLHISCCRNSCHLAWIVILWARVPFAFAYNIILSGHLVSCSIFP